MESAHDDVERDAVANAVRAASIAQFTRKKAEKAAKEALELARKEMKRKSKVIEMRKADVRKKTMRSYFQSTQGAGGGQPLSHVFDGSMPEVLGAEPSSLQEYPSDEDHRHFKGGKKRTSLLGDTDVTPGSSSGSGDTIVLSTKSPLMTILEESDDHDNAKLLEIPGDSEGSDSELESPHKR